MPIGTTAGLSRRAVVAGLGLAASASPRRGLAATYPAKPIRLIVPFPPGGGTDLTARIAAQGVSELLGQNIIVENVEGAASQIGINEAVKASNDGYTLLWASSDGIAILPAVKPSVPYKVPGDFTFISGFASDPLIVVVNPKLPFTSMAELVAYGKAHPGQLKYSSSGVGGGGHLMAAYIGKAEGIEIVHLPYRGAAPALTAVVGGFADFTLPSSASAMSYITGGTLRALASTGQHRMAVLPDVPTVGEAGMPELAVDLCTGLYGPAGIPEPVVATLRGRMTDVLHRPATLARLRDLGLEPFDLGGPAFSDYTLKDLARWKEIAAKVNIRIN